MPEAWLVRAGRRIDGILRLESQPVAQWANRKVQRHRLRRWEG